MAAPKAGVFGIAWFGVFVLAVGAGAVPVFDQVSDPATVDFSLALTARVTTDPTPPSGSTIRPRGSKNSDPLAATTTSGDPLDPFPFDLFGDGQSFVVGKSGMLSAIDLKMGRSAELGSGAIVVSIRRLVANVLIAGFDFASILSGTPSEEYIALSGADPSQPCCFRTRGVTQYGQPPLTSGHAFAADLPVFDSALSVPFTRFQVSPVAVAAGDLLAITIGDGDGIILPSLQSTAPLGVHWFGASANPYAAGSQLAETKVTGPCVTEPLGVFGVLPSCLSGPSLESSAIDDLAFRTLIEDGSGQQASVGMVEPSSLAPFGAGLLGLFWARSRRLHRSGGDCYARSL